MKIGDILEWLAAAAFTVAAYLATHLAWPAVLVAALCLLYFAQCWTHQPAALPSIPRLRLRRKRDNT